MEVDNNNDLLDKGPSIDLNDANFLARLACLYEGVNIACDKAQQLGIDTKKSTAWIKPLAFQKYIKAREKDMKYQVDAWSKGDPECGLG